MHKIWMLVAALFGLAWGAPGQAVTLTYTVGLNFGQGIPGIYMPVSNVAQTFTVTFEPTLDVKNKAVDSYSTSTTAAPYQGPVLFISNYHPETKSVTLFFMGLPNTVNPMPGTNNFLTSFVVGTDGSIISNTSSSSIAFYSSSGNNYTNFFTHAFSVQLASPAPAAVPEPAAWGMMIAGIGAVGFALRRRQKVKAVVRFA